MITGQLGDGSAAGLSITVSHIPAEEILAGNRAGIQSVTLGGFVDHQFLRSVVVQNRIGHRTGTVVTVHTVQIHICLGQSQVHGNLQGFQIVQTRLTHNGLDELRAGLASANSNVQCIARIAHPAGADSVGVHSQSIVLALGQLNGIGVGKVIDLLINAFLQLVLNQRQSHRLRDGIREQLFSISHARDYITVIVLDNAAVANVVLAVLFVNFRLEALLFNQNLHSSLAGVQLRTTNGICGDDSRGNQAHDQHQR